MGTEIRVWHVGKNGVASVNATHPSLEADLEKWIKDAPEILGDDLLLIAEQKSLGVAGRFDLLAIDAEGRIVIIELKRGMLPREAVAKALDYASWLNDANEQEIRDIAKQFLGKDLDTAFVEEFDTELEEVDLRNHRIIVVAASLDTSTERIINYLAERHEMEINALPFTYCQMPSGESILARTVLVPEKQNPRRVPKANEQELMAVATKRGVAPLLQICRKLGPDDQVTEQVITGAFRYWRQDQLGKARVAFGISVSGDRFNTPNGELDVWIRPPALSQVTGIPEEDIRSTLNKDFAAKERSKRKSTVRLKSPAEAERLISQLRKWFELPSKATGAHAA